MILITRAERVVDTRSPDLRLAGVRINRSVVFLRVQLSRFSRISHLGMVGELRGGRCHLHTARKHRLADAELAKHVCFHATAENPSTECAMSSSVGRKITFVAALPRA